MNDTYEKILAELNNNADKAYDDFNSRIVNSEYPTIGVRIPVIKKLAKSVPIGAREAVLNGFFEDNAPTFESVLFAGVLAARKGESYDKTREYLSRIVPLFGSWAHVDCVTPCLKWVDKSVLDDDFKYLLKSQGQYQKRFYIMILMSCCLCDEYIDKILLVLLKNVDYGQYYVDMAAAWLLAECLVKYYDKTLPLFTAQHFPSFVHNKAIQKARESFRVPPDIKNYLNTLKVKSK